MRGNYVFGALIKLSPTFFFFLLLLLLPPRTVKHELWKAAEEIIASCKYRGWDAKDVRWLLFGGDITNHLLGVNAAPPPRRGSAYGRLCREESRFAQECQARDSASPSPRFTRQSPTYCRVTVMTFPFATRKNMHSIYFHSYVSKW